MNEVQVLCKKCKLVWLAAGWVWSGYPQVGSGLVIRGLGRVWLSAGWVESGYPWVGSGLVCLAARRVEFE